MRRFVILAVLGLLAVSFAFAAVAAAQEEGQQQEIFENEIAEEQAEDPQEPAAENALEGQLEGQVEQQVEAAQGGANLTPEVEAAIDQQSENQAPRNVQVQEQAEATFVTPEGKGAEATVERSIATGAPLPESGGPLNPSLLLPTAALLLGSGLLTYAILHRR